jgi:hypothetical protein
MNEMYNKPSHRVTITCEYTCCTAKATRKIKTRAKMFLCDEHAKIICEGIVFRD